MIFFLNRVLMVRYGDFFVEYVIVQSQCLFYSYVFSLIACILYLGRNSEWCECMLLDLTDL